MASLDEDAANDRLMPEVAEGLFRKHKTPAAAFAALKIEKDPAIAGYLIKEYFDAEYENARRQSETKAK